MFKDSQIKEFGGSKEFKAHLVISKALKVYKVLQVNKVLKVCPTRGFKEFLDKRFLKEIKEFKVFKDFKV